MASDSPIMLLHADLRAALKEMAIQPIYYLRERYHHIKILDSTVPLQMCKASVKMNCTKFLKITVGQLEFLLNKRVNTTETFLKPQ